MRQTVVEVPGEQGCPFCRAGHRGRLIQRTTAEHLAAKSEASTDRWASLQPPVVEVLTRHRMRMDAWRDEAGAAFRDHGLVWCQPDGGPLYPRSVTAAVSALFAERGLEGVTPKALRRGTASLLANRAGLPAEVIAKVLGHATGDVTREHYVRAERATLAGASATVAELLWGASA